MSAERHSVSIQKPDGHSLVPNPFVSKPFAVAIDEVSRKRHLRK